MADLRSEAARAMGRARTEKKKQASQESLKTARETRWSDPEAKERFAAAMRESWARRKAAKAEEGDRRNGSEQP